MPLARSCLGVFKSAWNVFALRKEALFKGTVVEHRLAPAGGLQSPHLQYSPLTPRYLSPWLPATVFWVQFGQPRKVELEL